MFRVSINVEDAAAQWTMRVDAVDLATLLHLDSDQDEAITQAELEAGSEAITTYLSQRLLFETDGVPCHFSRRDEIAVDDRQDAYLVDLRGTWACPQLLGIVALTNRTLMDHFAGYQHYAVISSPLGRVEHMFTQTTPATRIRLGEPIVAEAPLERGLEDSAPLVTAPTSALGRIGLFISEGIEHILIGFDHVLFVIGLAIAAQNLRRLALIITSFTVAHSITLALAAFQVVTIPSSIAEAVIALSVAYIGFENLFWTPRRRAFLAFAFGLIHGVGFSSVLAQRLEVLEAYAHHGQLLFGFNVGVEVGQLLIVLLVYPAVVALRSKNAEKWPVRIVSAGILVAGLWWTVERALLG